MSKIHILSVKLDPVAGDTMNQQRIFFDKIDFG